MPDGWKELSGRQTAVAGAALALGASVLALVPWGGETVRLAVFLGAVLFAPGYALARHLPSVRMMEETTRIALAFPFSVAILTLPLFAAQLAGFGGGVVKVLFHPLLLLAAALLLLARDDERPRANRPKRYPTAVLALTLLLMPLAVSKGALIDLNSDCLDHIAYLQEIQNTGKNFPTTAYFEPSTDRAYDVRKGFLQPVIAWIAALAGADAIRTWHTLPALAMFFFSLSYFALARGTLGEGAPSWIAWLLALVCFDTGIGGRWFYRAGTPFLFAGPMIWAFLLLAFRASRSKKPVVGPPLLVGFALMSCHIFAAVVAALLGLFHVLVSMIVHRERAKWGAALISLAALGAGLLPVGIWRFATSYPPLDPIHTHLQGFVWVGKGLYVCNPLAAVKRTAILGIAAIPLALLLARRARRDEGILFALTITLVPYAVILNPLLVPVVVPVLGYLIDRIAWYGGNYLVLGVLVGSWAEALRARPGGRMVPAAAGLALVAALFGVSLAAGDRQERWKSLTFHHAPGYEEQGPEDWSDLFQYLRENVPPRATVATDPATGYLIPAYTPQKTLAVRAQHSSPADPAAIRRLEDAVRVMSPYVNSVETAAILEEYGAKYVLLNFRFDRPLTLEYGGVDPALYEPTLAKFRADPRYYRPIYEHDRVHLFQITGNLAELSPHLPVLRATVDAVPPGARAVNELFPNRVRLLAASVAGPEETGTGEIEIRSFWRKEGETADVLPYRLYVRLDRKGDEARGGKLGRKLKQLTSGELYRARTRTNLVHGAYPPFAWRVGDLVADTFRYRPPAKLAPGTYRVELLLRRKPHMQNFYLDDFFSERDSFSGVTVGTVRVGGGSDA